MVELITDQGDEIPVIVLLGNDQRIEAGAFHVLGGGRPWWAKYTFAEIGDSAANRPSDQEWQRAEE